MKKKQVCSECAIIWWQKKSWQQKTKPAEFGKKLEASDSPETEESHCSQLLFWKKIFALKLLIISSPKSTHSRQIAGN